MYNFEILKSYSARSIIPIYEPEKPQAKATSSLERFLLSLISFIRLPKFFLKSKTTIILLSIHKSDLSTSGTCDTICAKMEFDMLHQVILIELKCLTQKSKKLFDSDFLPPKDGVRDFLEKLSKIYTVKVYYKGNLDKLLVWIVQNKLTPYIDDITRKKEKCDFLISQKNMKIIKEIAYLHSPEFFLNLA